MRLLFWEPYNRAAQYDDYRDLLKAYEEGHFLCDEPEVRQLLAAYMRTQRKPSRRSQIWDKTGMWKFVNEVIAEFAANPTISDYRAMKNVLERHENLNPDTLKFWWTKYKREKKAHDKIIEENQ